MSSETRKISHTKVFSLCRHELSELWDSSNFRPLVLDPLFLHAVKETLSADGLNLQKEENLPIIFNSSSIRADTPRPTDLKHSDSHSFVITWLKCAGEDPRRSPTRPEPNDWDQIHEEEFHFVPSADPGHTDHTCSGLN